MAKSFERTKTDQFSLIYIFLRSYINIYHKTSLGWASFQDGLLLEMGFFSRLLLQTQEMGFFPDECCKF